MDAQTVDIITRIAVGVIVSLITTFVIPAVLSWGTNLMSSKLKTFIDNAVDAAEQIYGPKTAGKKKSYVLDIIHSKCKRLLKRLKINDETLDMMIEASVSRVSASVKQAKDVSIAVASAAIKDAHDITGRVLTDTATETDNGLIVAKQETKKYRSKGDGKSGGVSMS